MNEYIVDIDEERGVLLRFAAIVDGKEAGVLGARSVTFDEPIPDAVFTERHAARAHGDEITVVPCRSASRRRRLPPLSD